MFQAMGNTMPSLVTSFVRVVVVAIPVFLLARRADFALHWVWYLTVISVTLQMVVSLLLLRREFRRRLAFAPPTAVAPAAGLVRTMPDGDFDFSLFLCNTVGGSLLTDCLEAPL